MNCWHLTLSSDGRVPLFPDEPRRRAAVRRLARVAGGDMALFGVVDDHVHLVVLATRARAGRIAQSLMLSLAKVADAKLDPSRIRAVDTRSHLQWLVRYILTQLTHYGVDAQPALWSGSCFQDLVGARQLAGLKLRIREVLPRLRTRDMQAMVGLDEAKLQPASNDAVRGAGAVRLVNAAAAALAVGPELRGNKPEVVQARRAAIQLASAVELSLSELAWALGLTQRAVLRLRKPAVPAATLTAVRLRLALESAVQAT